MSKRTPVPANDTQTFTHQHSGFFALRAPLLPLAAFGEWGTDLKAPSAGTDRAELAEALAADRAQLRRGLRAWLAKPEIREAIFVASPDLDDYLELWEREPDSKRGRRAEEALVRYFGRMASRATPFGLFASVTLGRIGDDTRLTIAPETQRHTRLDMDYLFALLDALNQDQSLSRRMRYYPNSSLYQAAGRVRYLEARLNGKERTYHLVGAEADEALTATLQRASQGARRDELAAALVDDEITQAEAEDYISQLIESQILAPELALPVTGAEPIHQVIDQLNALSAEPSLIQTLDGVRRELAQFDAQGLGVAPARYRAVAERLSALPARVELPRLFQVDLVRNAPDAELSEAVVAEIARGVELLRRLFGGQQTKELTRFREAFMARYEGREVPLVEVLDNELGIGFPAGQAATDVMPPLLQNLPWLAGDPNVKEWGARQDALLRKLTEVLSAGETVLELSEQDVEQLQDKEPAPLPDAFEALGTLAAESDEALAAGDFQFHLQYVGGPSGGRLLGRFCHADDALRQAVGEHLRAEEALQSDKVFVEITHLPEGRVGNILARPVMRTYELPYLGRSGALPEQQLPITDLLLSEHNGRLILRSRRLGREVLPRLTCAHNWRRESSPLYNFLCELQGQNLARELIWSWTPLEAAPFLPRVTYGRLILFKARWAVSQAELRRLSEERGVDLFCAVQRWRAERRLPRWVVLADGDNTLPLDLENVLCVESFARVVKGRERVVLQELWPAPDQTLARGDAGRFTHEIVVPFVRRRADEKPDARAISEERSKITAAETARQQTPLLRRRFAPGSEWLYAKIYCGPVEVDRVLREAVGPLARRAMAEGLADRWFFVRYFDPEWHLRVRFRGKPRQLLSEVFPALHAALEPLVAEGALWRVQLDTYEPEIERYGGVEGVGLAEQLFHADSEAVVEILELLDSGGAGLDERLRLTLCGMDRLLNDLGFDLATKIAIFKRARAAFLAEFRADDRMRAQLSERYRRERQSFAELLAPDWPPDHPLAPGLEILAQRSQRLAPVAASLREAEQAGRLAWPLPYLAASYLHMHANHLLGSAQRAQEMALYDWLTRLHSAQLARGGR